MEQDKHGKEAQSKQNCDIPGVKLLCENCLGDHKDTKELRDVENARMQPEASEQVGVPGRNPVSPCEKGEQIDRSENGNEWRQRR